MTLEAVSAVIGPVRVILASVVVSLCSAYASLLNCAATCQVTNSDMSISAEAVELLPARAQLPV
jgi:hypothetical protein